MTIHYENTLFRDLIKKYKTWDELKSFLESDEGGLFRIVDSNDSGLCIIRYEKGVSKMDLPHSRWFRSVVWDSNRNIPVSIAPPKTTNSEFPYKTLNELVDANIVCQELLDGVMINCFRMIRDNTLHITSRSKLDATGKFYSEKSFRELFMEAYMNTYGRQDYNEQIIQDNSSEIRTPDSSKGEVAVFYSFLVQHKEHRIVKKIDTNKVFVVARGVVFEDGRVEIEDSPELSNYNLNLKNIDMKLEYNNQKMLYSKIASFTNEGEKLNNVNNWIKYRLSMLCWNFQGYVFKDNIGNRWRFRAERYTAVKSLRGNTPIVRDRFAQLYSQNLIHKYLEYYPEDAMAMTIYLMFVNSIIQKLYDLYVELHITKEKKIDDIDKIFWPHLYNIHGIYLTQLRPENKKININEIQLYLHKQPWQRISFLIKSLVDTSS